MARTVTISLRLDANQPKEAIKGLEDAFTQLDRYASQHVRHIQETLNSLRGFDLSSVTRQFQQSQQTKQPTIGNDLNKFAVESERIAKQVANNKIREEMRAATQIARIQQQGLKQSQANDRILEQTDTRLANHRIKEAERAQKIASDKFLALAKEVQGSSKQSNSGNNASFGKDLFSTILGASTLSGLAVNAIGAVVNEIKTLASDVIDLGVTSVKLAADFQDTTNALTVFAGSSRLAKEEIAAVDKAARDTVGLRLQTAEEGYTRLRALGFAAENSRNLVVGLAKEKLISNASEQDVNRVIVNLTQLSAGSSRASQDIKEIIHAMPSMRAAFEDAFGTADPKKLKAFIDSDPEAAFTKLADAMAKVRTPAGGLNNDIDKMSDTFVEAGRAFGEPVLEPLAESIRGITDFLKQNKDTWSDWGNAVGDIIRGTNAEAAKWKEGLSGENGSMVIPAVWQAIKTTVNMQTGGGGYSVRDLGAKERLSKESETAWAKTLREDAEFLAESEVLYANYYAKKARAAEIAKAKELAGLKLSSDEANTILKNRFEIEQALRDSTVRYTSEQEKAFAEINGQAKSRFLQSEIARQSGFLDKSIALQSGNDEEIGKLTLEKNKILSGLNKDYLINEANTQKQVKEFERKIIEERRAALIDFKQFAVEQSKFSLDNKSFDISRAISQGTTQAGEGFARLKEITQKSYQEISQLTKESFDLQLQNESLSVEQRSNLIERGYFEQQKLAEDNRRSIIDISDKQNAELIDRLGKYRQQASETYKAIGDSFSSAQSAFFNPETFSSSTFNELQKVLLRKPEQAVLNNKIADSKNNEQTVLTARNSFYSSVGDDLTPKQTEALNKLNDAYNSALTTTGEYYAELNKITDSIPAAYYEFERLAKLVGQGNVGAFDEAAKAGLKYRQILERADVESQIGFIKDKIDLENKLAITENRIGNTRDLYFQLGQAQRQKEKLSLDQNIQSVEQYRSSLKGLTEHLTKLQNGDKSEVTGVQYAAQKTILSEQINSLNEIITLKERLAHSPLIDSLSIEKAQLQDIIDLRNRETSAIITANRAQLELSQAMKVSNNEIRAQVLDHLSQQKTLSQGIADGINSTYDTLANKLDEQIDKAFEWAKGFAGIFTEPLKAISKNALSNFTSGILDSILPPEIAKAFQKGSDNPIVNQQIKTNDLLKDIKTALSSPIGSIGGAGNLTAGSVVGALAGGGSGGGLNSPNVIKNLIGGGNSNYGTRTGDSIDGVMQVIAGDKGRGDIFSNLKNLFSTKDGGLFGKGINPFTGKEGTKGAGIAGGIGSLTQIAGSLIGGRVGGFISGAGQGLALGAQLGSIIPGVGTVIGAAIGAAAGGLLSLLGGDPKRKADKKQLPQLQQVFTDDLAKLRELAANKNAILQNPDGVISQANELKNHIAAGGGLTWASKKYKAQAALQIAAKVTEADSIISQIKEFAQKAQSANSLSGHIVGEFASGTYMSPDFLKQYGDFKRRNGMMPGAFTGRDTLPSMIATGEMVLNPRQIANVIHAVGEDPFPYAGIPNYPSKPKPIKGYADGNYFGTGAPSFSGGSSSARPSSDGDKPIYLTVNLFKDDQGNWKQEAESDGGRKVIANIVEKKFANGELKFQKR